MKRQLEIQFSQTQPTAKKISEKTGNKMVQAAESSTIYSALILIITVLLYLS
ncbi:MAG: hypothetical protein PHR45_07815 [Muribaculaceae bacterium]|nr:hypothetical protein [Muribaculaceae bacterium]